MKLHLMLGFVLVSGLAGAQQAPLVSPILDKLAGHWVLRGEIAHKATVHDVDAAWAIQHHYLRVHEVSREKNDRGQPAYEAEVMIGFVDATKTYSCVWLDVYGGTSMVSIGVAAPQENELAFVFKDEKGEESFHNDFVYDPAAKTWEWKMDNIDKGVAKPFARVKLSRE